MPSDSNFDWVMARSECSIAKVFKSLEMGTRADIEKINKLTKPNRVFEFSTANGHFSAMEVTGQGPIKSVNFAVSNGTIKISGDDDRVLFEAVLTLDNDGQCKLKTKSGEQLDQWQFRRIALEDLFFGPRS